MSPFRRGRGCAAGLGGRGCSPAERGSRVPALLLPALAVKMAISALPDPWCPPRRPEVLAAAAAGSGSSPSPALLQAGLNREQRALPPGRGPGLGQGQSPRCSTFHRRPSPCCKGLSAPCRSDPGLLGARGGEGSRCRLGWAARTGTGRSWQGDCSPALVPVGRLEVLLGFFLRSCYCFFSSFSLSCGHIILPSSPQFPHP